MFQQDPEPQYQEAPYEEKPKRGGFKLDSKTIIIGVVLLVAAMFIVPQLLGGNDDENNQDGYTGTYDEPGVPDESQPVNPGDEQLNDDAALGAVVAAAGVDRDNCPVQQTTTFDNSDEIYVVAQDSDVAIGTSVFVRLYRDGELIEDAPEITASEDYQNTCIAFVFEPTNTAGFEPGNYEALFVVNGNEAESVTFQVQ